MMKKLCIALSLIALPCLSMAQDAEDVKFGPYEKSSKFSDNLYFGIDGGVNWLVNGDMFKDPVDKRLLSPMVDLYVGKSWSPVLGTNIKIDFAMPYYKERFSQFGAGFEIPVNVSNWVLGYDKNRAYNFIPFVGGGIKVGLNKDLKDMDDAHKFASYVSAGIKNSFRINDNWNFNLNLAYEALDRAVAIQKNTYKGKNKWRGECEITIGLQYTINPGFNAVERCSSATCHTACDSKIGALEQQLADCNNSKNAALAALEKEKARKCPTATTVAPTMSVFFKINSAKVMDNYKYNLKYYADAIKASNDTYTVYGYADLQTGSRAYNEKLAQKRAEEVKRILVEEYGCNASQIECAAGNLESAPFDKAVYNRAVLVKTK